VPILSYRSACGGDSFDDRGIAKGRFAVALKKRDSCRSDSIDVLYEYTTFYYFISNHT